MFVAKLATNVAKPDGVHVVPHNNVIEFLHPLPINALWGVGEKTAEQLQRLGLQTVGDIANTPQSTLIKLIGQAAGEHLYDLAWARDPRSVTVNVAEKSVSNERTFSQDVDDPEFIYTQLLDLSNKVARRLRAGGFTAKTISIRVKFADFTSITRSKSLTASTDVGNDIYKVAKSLYDALNLQRVRVRLVGVKADGLSDSGDFQMTLETKESGWRETEQVMDKVSEKFGKSSVKPARLIRRNKPSQTEN